MNPIMCVLPVSRCANYAAPSTPALGARSSASDLQCGRRSLVAGDHRDGPEHGPEAGTAPEASEGADAHRQIGRAHVRTPVTNAQLVCRLLLEQKKNCKLHDTTPTTATHTITHHHT